MEHYNIIITPDAASDMIQLKNYIAYTLQVPETAVKYIRSIRKEIEKLDTLPGAIALVSDEPWHSRGVKRKIFKNFYIYFRIDEDTNRVYILNVIYARRNQLNALSEYKKS